MNLWDAARLFMARFTGAPLVWLVSQRNELVLARMWRHDTRLPRRTTDRLYVYDKCRFRVNLHPDGSTDSIVADTWKPANVQAEQMFMTVTGMLRPIA